MVCPHMKWKAGQPGESELVERVWWAEGGLLVGAEHMELWEGMCVFHLD